MIAEEQLEAMRRGFNDLLHHNVMQITFKKMDGTERKMICTLKPDIVPKVEVTEEKKSKRKVPMNTISVWDIENSGWRSFAIDSVEIFAFYKEPV